MSNTDEIIKSIDDACASLPLRDYVETLGDVIDNLQIKMAAAECDLQRQEESDE